MQKTRIVLAEDHGVVRASLRRFIESEGDLEIVGEAANGQQAVEMVKQLLPDIVLLDVSMPVLDGPAVSHMLKEACPQVKVLALTFHEDAACLRQLLDAGAVGYVLKQSTGDELIQAIRSVATGGIFIDSRMTMKVISSMVEADKGRAQQPVLSERENEVLRKVAQGYTNKEIASQLGVSPKTVETYKARSMEKLALRNRVDVVRLAGERGWLR